MILDHLYDVPCKILHAPAVVKKGELYHSLIDHVDAIQKHFQNVGSPIMMGGDVDASSKGECQLITTTFLLN